MEDKNIQLAANILFNHRLNKSGLKKLPTNLIPSNIDEGYQIQNELNILYLTLSENICIGKKIGCTNLLGNIIPTIFKLGSLLIWLNCTSACSILRFCV